MPSAHHQKNTRFWLGGLQIPQKTHVCNSVGKMNEKKRDLKNCRFRPSTKQTLQQRKSYIAAAQHTHCSNAKHDREQLTKRTATTQNILCNLHQHTVQCFKRRRCHDRDQLLVLPDTTWRSSLTLICLKIQITNSLPWAPQVTFWTTAITIRSTFNHVKFRPEVNPKRTGHHRISIFELHNSSFASTPVTLMITHCIPSCRSTVTQNPHRATFSHNVEATGYS